MCRTQLARTVVQVNHVVGIGTVVGYEQKYLTLEPWMVRVLGQFAKQHQHRFLAGALARVDVAQHEYHGTRISSQLSRLTEGGLREWRLSDHNTMHRASLGRPPELDFVQVRSAAGQLVNELDDFGGSRSSLKVALLRHGQRTGCFGFRCGCSIWIENTGYRGQQG